MGKLNLAMVEIKNELRAVPDDPEVVYTYLDILPRIVDLEPRVEVNSMTTSVDLSPLVLSARINILAQFAEGSSFDHFSPLDEQVSALADRFDQAVEHDGAEPAIVALAYFNRGVMHLRAGRTTLAREAFENAKRRTFRSARCSTSIFHLRLTTNTQSISHTCSRDLATLSVAAGSRLSQRQWRDHQL